MKLLETARRILDCERGGCNRYCHACLLGFDTQDAASHLNRTRGDVFLSRDFLDALRLPVAAQLFGNDTRLELNDVLGSVLVELGRCGASQLRVFAGGLRGLGHGDLATRPAICVQIAASGVKVVLVVPEDVLTDMEWDETAALRARMNAASIELAVAPPGGVRCGTGWMLVELGGASQSVRWAVTDERLIVPGDGWGESAATEEPTARCVRVGPEAALGDLRLRAPRRDELEKPRPGVFREVVFRRDLDGDLAQVGRKFWTALAKEDPGLSARLSGSTPLDEVTYEDRFVVSPLNAAVAFRVLSELTTRPGGVVGTTAVTIRTTSAIAYPQGSQQRSQMSSIG